MVGAIALVLLVIVGIAYTFFREESQRLIGMGTIYLQLGEPLSCQNFASLSLREEPGLGYPGVAGAPRWGFPEEAPTELRVRRSWTTLSEEAKRQFVDGILLMKRTKVTSGLPGAERAAYQSLCPSGQSYELSLYDYYAELHTGAFATLGSVPHHMMPHMGPHFIPWHRYLLLRFERDMQIVLNDPTFALPYWDWDDCQQGSGDGSNPCPAIFEEDFLGSHGGLEGADEVTGYLVEQGFEVNIWAEGSPTSFFNTDGILCGSRPFRRSVGTDAGTNFAAPSSADTIQGGFLRPFYDVEPYEQCVTDDTQSFRMYLEGYRPNDEMPCWFDGRCARHGLGHVYIGGDMVNSANPNDPMFFLHHNNVDRIWAMWQDNNRLNPDTSVDYGNPGFPAIWRTSIFNFPDVQVEELFNFRALGYAYDTSEGE